MQEMFRLLLYGNGHEHRVSTGTLKITDMRAHRIRAVLMHGGADSWTLFMSTARKAATEALIGATAVIVNNFES